MSNCNLKSNVKYGNSFPAIHMKKPLTNYTSLPLAIQSELPFSAAATPNNTCKNIHVPEVQERWLTLGEISFWV